MKKEFYGKIDHKNPPQTLDNDTFLKTSVQTAIEEKINTARLVYDSSPTLGEEEFLLRDEFESVKSYEIKKKFYLTGYHLKKGIGRISSSVLRNDIHVSCDYEIENEIALKTNTNQSVYEFCHSVIHEILISDVCYAFTYANGDKPKNKTEESNEKYRGVTDILHRESIIDHLTIQSKSTGIEQICVYTPKKKTKLGTLKYEFEDSYTFYVKDYNYTKVIRYTKDENDNKFILDDEISTLEYFPITKIWDGGIPIACEIANAQIRWMNREANTRRFVDKLSHPMGIGHGLNSAVIDTVKATGVCSMYKENTEEWYKCAIEKMNGNSFISKEMQDGKKRIDFEYVELNGSNYDMQERNMQTLEKYMVDGFVRIVKGERANKSAVESKNEASEAINFFSYMSSRLQSFIDEIHIKNCFISGVEPTAEIEMPSKYTESDIDKTIYEIAKDVLDRGVVNEKGFKDIVSSIGIFDNVGKDGFMDVEVR